MNDVYRLHNMGQFWLALEADRVAVCAEDYDDLEAKLNDLRPSFRRRLRIICTQMIVRPQVTA